MKSLNVLPRFISPWIPLRVVNDIINIFANVSLVFIPGKPFDHYFILGVGTFLTWICILQYLKYTPKFYVTIFQHLNIHFLDSSIDITKSNTKYFTFFSNCISNFYRICTCRNSLFWTLFGLCLYEKKFLTL